MTHELWLLLFCNGSCATIDVLQHLCYDSQGNRMLDPEGTMNPRPEAYGSMDPREEWYDGKDEDLKRTAVEANDPGNRQDPANLI